MAPRLYHHPVQGDLSQSLIANNLQLVGSLGHSYAKLEPRVFFAEQDLIEARRLLSEAGVRAASPGLS